jgi:hypothetical protein
MTYRSSARKSVRVVRRQRGAKQLQSIATRPRGHLRDDMTRPPDARHRCRNRCTFLCTGRTSAGPRLSAPTRRDRRGSRTVPARTPIRRAPAIAWRGQSNILPPPRAARARRRESERVLAVRNPGSPKRRHAPSYWLDVQELRQRVGHEEPAVASGESGPCCHDSPTPPSSVRH